MKGSRITKIEISKTASSPPDIDSDFGDRNAIIEYLISKYGEDHVFTVGTTSFVSLKTAIGLLCPVFNVSGAEKNAVTKILNDNLTIEENMAESDIITEFFMKYPMIREHAPNLVGTINAWGKHAGGIVIFDKKFPASKYIPLRRNSEKESEEGDMKIGMTSFPDKDELEFLGGVKMDILGLNTCIQVHKVKRMHGFNPYELYEQDDIKVYKYIVDNLKYRNIFQFSSNQGEKALKDIRPMSLVDLSASSAVIRLTVSDVGREFYDLFVKHIRKYQEGDKDYWKNQLAETIYDTYNLEACKMILDASYGVLIYQEQLIRMINILSRGAKTYQDGNDVRKLLDKKINQKYGSIDAVLEAPREVQRKWHKDLMSILDEYLLPYIGMDGYDCPNPEISEFLKFDFDSDKELVVPKTGIVGMVVSCSAYLFSILHARAYSMTTYEQMYQKYYYEKEFWLTALNDGLAKQLNTNIRGIALESNLTVLPPSVNFSEREFTIEGDKIRFGLARIAKMDSASKDIIIERNANGLFKSVEDFLTRTAKYKNVNKSAIENLVYSNAFKDLKLQNPEDCLKLSSIDGSDIQRLVEFIQEKTNAFAGAEFFFSQDDASVSEFLALSTNISFHHSLMSEFENSTAVEDIADGQAEQVIVRIEEVKEKKSKKGKVYKYLKITCLKTQKEYGIFCWLLDFKVYKGQIRYLKISNKDGFLSLAFAKQW